MTYNQLTSKAANLFTNFCYFEIIKSINHENSLFILISKFGNISFFLNKGNPINENVYIKTFYIPNDYKIISLVFSKRKIYNHEILNSSNKYINLN